MPYEYHGAARRRSFYPIKLSASKAREYLSGVCCGSHGSVTAGGAYEGSGAQLGKILDASGFRHDVEIKFIIILIALVEFRANEVPLYPFHQNVFADQRMLRIV